MRAQVTREILACHTVDRFAKQTGTSSQTVRTQLKRLVAKIGVGHQAELVRPLTGAELLRSLPSLTRKGIAKLSSLITQTGNRNKFCPK